MSLRLHRLAFPLLALMGVALARPAQSQFLDPAYSSNYSVIFNGPAGDTPINYGGLLFQAGDPNTLLLMGNANNTGGTLHGVSVIRGAGNHITGLGPFTTSLAAAERNDGGLVYAPNGTLLYTRYSSNELGQIKPGSVITNKTVDLSALGVSSSVGTLQYVPSGFGGAGKLKLVSYSSGDWYDMGLTPDANGTYDVSVSASVANTNVGPEGVVYVKGGNPLFSVDTMLITEYGASKVTAWDVDANGNPTAGTRRDFIVGLSGAEGGTIDPLTGDFVFSTFGSINSIVVVSGFNTPRVADTPEPGAIALFCSLGTIGLFSLRRRRSRSTS